MRTGVVESVVALWDILELHHSYELQESSPERTARPLLKYGTKTLQRCHRAYECARQAAEGLYLEH